MAIIKCKMCGGDLEIAAGVTVAECEYCGAKQTLPKANEEVIQNLFNRANALRLKCEFDKAEQIYEKILQENDAEAEAHWGIVLCKYGIEYVEDPKTYKRIPTCHRTSYDAVTADTDYLAAIENADAVQRSIYEAEAKAIDEIQKNILSIVKDEKPFDVFLCYKETDENGKRTIDSAIANDIYYQLTQEGLKVFYAAITLEDKLGQEYEPYIFAAINSAKVMLVIGTQPHYFTSVWVKNEWSRFMKLMKTDRSKLLIPCYKDMDAYELPEEFAHLQAQDMSKIGFINDVVRGIKKVTAKDEPKAAAPKEVPVEIAPGHANVEALVDRAVLLLEDGENQKAEEVLEQALNIAPKNPMIYVCKLMMQLGVKKQEALADVIVPYDNSPNYEKAIRFADAQLRETLEGYAKAVNENNLKVKYSNAVAKMDSSSKEDDFLTAKEMFDQLADYADAKELAAACGEKAEAARKESVYQTACDMMHTNSVTDLRYTIAKFQNISGYKDADKKAAICQEKIDQLKAKEVADRKEQERLAEIAKEKAAILEEKRRKNLMIISGCAGVVGAIVLFIYILTTAIIPGRQYKNGLELMSQGKYEEAYTTFKDLDDFKDSRELCTEVQYQQAMFYWENKDYEESNRLFRKLGPYKDSLKKIHNHDFASEIITAPGCETPGEEKLTCKDCAYSKNETVAATGHSYGEPQIIKAASCTAKGEQKSVCAACGNAQTKEIEMTAHKYSAATCTAPAKCADCGRTTGSAAGHSYSAATCTAAKKCSRCGTTSGSALGHTTGGTKCTRCGVSTFKTITYSGTGFKAITNIVLPEGDYVIKYKATTTSRNNNKFYFNLYYANGNLAAYECSHAYPDDPVNSQKTFDGPINNGKLVVDAESNVSWTFTIEAI